MNKKNASERGQVIIFIVLGFVLILGFTGLAIDGGLVYSNRRNAQNAADAASLAGGGEAASYMEKNNIYYTQWNCASAGLQTAMTRAINTAITRAASNGFTIDNDYDADWNGVETRCDSQAYNNGAMIDRYIDVITRITTTTDPIFVSFFTQQDVVVEVEAVTRVRPRMPLAYGNAIVALNTAGCSGNKYGLQLGGSLVAHVTGGGFWTNGCVDGDGANWVANVEDGGLSYVGQAGSSLNFYDENGNLITPNHAAAPLPADSYAVPTPNCNPPAVTLTKIDGSMDLQPGLYCITGTGNVIRLANHEYLRGDGVTIYVPYGEVDISGQAELDLKAPGANPVNNAISGVLFYVNTSGGKGISIEGNENTVASGLIYAPNTTIKMTGSSTLSTPVTFSTQVIGLNVFVSGNVTLDIHYEQDENYNRPTSMELAR